MADEEQLAILRQGPNAWNAWRREHPVTIDLGEDGRGLLDLSDVTLHGVDFGGACLEGTRFVGADLYGADLSGANLARADLSKAGLGNANLSWANLGGAVLINAYLDSACLEQASLVSATLIGAHLANADLRGADLRRATLARASFVNTTLIGANLAEARLLETVLSDLDLGTCMGLDECIHVGPSTIDHRTLQQSGPLPLTFLRGIGLPDNLIDYLPSLLNQPIQFYSCFISYSSKDQEFAERLYADLQAKGVRCWFAPHDMKIGAKILDAIDEAIRLRDKVLLVLSEGAIASDWVEGEVTRALDEERQRKRPLLFPVRIDDSVLDTKEAWARVLRGQRNIGDFTRWKEHDAYQKGLGRLLRDLTVEATGARPST